MSSIKSIVKKFIPESILQRIQLKKLERSFIEGYANFQQTGQTPHESYMALIKMYCATNGKFNETFHNKITLENPSRSASANIEGIVGSFSAKDFISINAGLNEKGYVHFEKKLSKQQCDRLYLFALKTGAKIPPDYNKKIEYDPANPLAEIYRFDIQDLINNHDIQQLITDPVLLNIARNYLGCEPIFDFPAMWWSTAFRKNASEEAAQLYHFDMDRIKWLKIFFYINDVTEENGPHCYIEGTHKVNAKPASILKREYARISDQELLPFYPQTALKMVCGEAGSIFAGDTKCWHKGMNLKNGHRLVLELEYTSSLFGVNYPKMEVINPTEGFRHFCNTNKIFAKNIHFKN